MKTNPGWMTQLQVEKAAKKAEHAAALVRGIVVSMDALKKEQIHVLNHTALDEGVRRLTTFATSAIRGLNGPDTSESGPVGGPDSVKQAPKHRKKKP